MTMPSRLQLALRAHREVRPASSAKQSSRLMFFGCSESAAISQLLTAFPTAYVLQNLARPPQDLDPTARATLEHGVLALGVRHVVVCGHSGCWGDGSTLTPEASHKRVLARCRTILADGQLGPLLRRGRVTMEALWFDEASWEVYAFDLEGRLAHCLGSADLTSMFSRFDELSA